MTITVPTLGRVELEARELDLVLGMNHPRSNIRALHFDGAALRDMLIAAKEHGYNPHVADYGPKG